MKISIITANFNTKRYIEDCIRSVISQRAEGVDVEYLVIDAVSTDGSLDIIRKYEKDIDVLVVEKDAGPADAINKGLARATGDVVAWLNSDDQYFPGALRRVMKTMEANPGKALCFGHCPIIQGDVLSSVQPFHNTVHKLYFSAGNVFPAVCGCECRLD
jgi:glycosyltransferase involved in cell wall biosynthesis